MMVNQRIIDAQILHLIHLTRFQNGLASDTAGTLRREVYPEVMRIIIPEVDRIEGMSMQSGTLTYAQQIALQELREKLLEVFSIHQIRSSLNEALGQLSEVEAEFITHSYEEITGETFLPPILSDQYVQQPFDGRNLDGWLDKLGLDSTERVMRTISNSLMSGAALTMAYEAIRGTRQARYTDGNLHTLTKQMEAVARSAVNHVNDQATRDFEVQNKEKFHGVVVIGILDTRRCIVCAAYEEETHKEPWKLGEGPTIPFHLNCRCKRVPFFDAEVPPRETYGQWFARQNDEVQDIILGESKGRLYRQGGLKIRNFVADGEELTLAQLRELYPNAFEKADL